MNQSNGNVTILKRYSEALKRHVAAEYERGGMSLLELSEEYGTSKASIYNWVKRYGKMGRSTKIVRVVMKNEKERIRELEKALADAHLKIIMKDSLLEAYEEEIEANYEEVKKRLSTEQLERLEKARKAYREYRSKDSVKTSG